MLIVLRLLLRYSPASMRVGPYILHIGYLLYLVIAALVI